VIKNLKVHQLEKYISYRVPMVVFCVIFSGDKVVFDNGITYNNKNSTNYNINGGCVQDQNNLLLVHQYTRVVCKRRLPMIFHNEKHVYWH
jgi:hypothetical protein